MVKEGAAYCLLNDLRVSWLGFPSFCSIDTVHDTFNSVREVSILHYCIEVV